MEALGFILQRFSYSLFSGCIINFFVMLNYFVLVKTNILPKNLLEGISFPESFNLLFFIVTAVFFSIIFEGICEYCVQRYTELYKENKVWIPRIFNRKKNRRTFYSFLLWNISRRMTVLEASFYYSKDEGSNGEAMRKLMQITECIIPIDAVYAGAKKIEIKEKNLNVYRFKDVSFIVQLLRLSFLLISVISGITGTVFFILWLCKGNEAHLTLSIFYAASLCVSIIANLPTNKIATYFSRRYVREVWRSYKALQKTATAPDGEAITQQSNT